jgi:hypothetical protein
MLSIASSGLYLAYLCIQKRRITACVVTKRSHCRRLNVTFKTSSLLGIHCLDVISSMMANCGCMQSIFLS